METNNQKLFSALSLCKKAGRLVLGFDAVMDSVYQGKAHLGLLASDVSEGPAQRVRRNCEDLAPCLQMPLAQADLCPVTWKKVGVYAVTDEQLAVLCRRSLEQNKEDNA